MQYPGVPDTGPKFTPKWEEKFQKWFKDIAKKIGIHENPDFGDYDYRAAFLAGVGPDPEEDFHWPSNYKHYTHENLLVDSNGEMIHSPTGQLLKDLLLPPSWEQEDLKGLNPHLDPLNTKMDEDTGLTLNPYLRKENLSAKAQKAVLGSTRSSTSLR